MSPLSDVGLVEATAAVLTQPRAEPPDSFILHAPLELLARAALLPHVSPDVRDRARRHITSIGKQFEEFGSPAGEHLASFDTVHEASAALREALDAGDLDLAGAAGRHLGRTLDPGALIAATGDLLAPSLAAAAHGPIFLHHLFRAMPRSPLSGAMFGTLARELARNHDWSLHWHEASLRGTHDLATALARTPVLGPPDSTFIRPLMVQAEESGLAAAIVGGAIGTETDVEAAERAILRTAAASMLLDDTTHAPYGWSHCLTIPQGILSTLPTSADPSKTLALAATHVVGIRAAFGCRPLAEIDGPAGRVGPDALVPGIDRPDAAAVQSTVDYAAGHEDAHLVKYVVSCLDASRRDPGGAHQYLAAAVHLADWWRALDS